MPKENRPGSILGDINPAEPVTGGDRIDSDQNTEADESMVGGSRHDRTRHPGSRDVTEGTSGGTGTEVGGTRNYRTGTGATGTDIGNRPE
jgi:hypothetical protein